MKKDELVNYVKRQLGYPTVNVEVTDDQIDDAISDAINEIKPWYTIFKYVTLDLNSHSIDMTPYKVKDVTDVIKVFDGSSISTSKSGGVDPFSYSGMSAYYSVPFYAMQKYSNSISTHQNIHRVISSYASMYQEQFYARLSSIMEQRAVGAAYDNISWKFYDNILYVDTGVPSTSVITVEYIPNLLEVSDFEDDNIYTNYLKQLSVAFSLLVQARVVGKYEHDGSPVRFNYSDMRSDAQKDIDRIREELVSSKGTSRFFITD